MLPTQGLRHLSVTLGAALLAVAVGCSDSGGAAGNGGSGGSGGQTTSGTGGSDAGTGGTHGGTGGTHGGAGGAVGDAGAGTGGAGDSHGTGGAGGLIVDASGATGGSSGTGGAHADAAPASDASADAPSMCTGSANAKACVTCCDARYPRGAQQAFFGNECLYCTDECRDTFICRGVASAGQADIDGPCLACVQRHMDSNCPATGGADCPSYVACLRQCPTN